MDTVKETVKAFLDDMKQIPQGMPDDLYIEQVLKRVNKWIPPLTRVVMEDSNEKNNHYDYDQSLQSN